MIPASVILSYALSSSIVGAPARISVEAPAGIMSSLRSAETQLEFAGGCLDGHADWGLDDRYELLDKRQLSLTREIAGIWGELESEPLEVMPTGQRRCWRSSAKDALRNVDRIFAHVTAQFATAALPLRRGAWIGSIAVCRDNVRSAAFGVERFTGQVSLAMRMTDSGQSLLARMTEQRVGQLIAIRVDGRVISTPQVNERVGDGMLEITGPDHAQLERVRVASAQRC